MDTTSMDKELEANRQKVRKEYSEIARTINGETLMQNCMQGATEVASWINNAITAAYDVYEGTEHTDPISPETSTIDHTLLWSHHTGSGAMMAQRRLIVERMLACLDREDVEDSPPTMDPHMAIAIVSQVLTVGAQLLREGWEDDDNKVHREYTLEGAFGDAFEDLAFYNALMGAAPFCLVVSALLKAVDVHLARAVRSADMAAMREAEANGKTLDQWVIEREAARKAEHVQTA